MKIIVVNKLSDYKEYQIPEDAKFAYSYMQVSKNKFIPIFVYEREPLKNMMGSILAEYIMKTEGINLEFSKLYDIVEEICEKEIDKLSLYE